MHRRWTAVVFGLACFGSLDSVPGAVDGIPWRVQLRLPLCHAQETSGQCLGFERAEEEKAIVYAIENSCEKKQTCSISWTVQCEDDKGAATQRSRKSTRVILKPTDKQSVSLSAESCKQSWRIEEVGWKCEDAR